MSGKLGAAGLELVICLCGLRWVEPSSESLGNVSCFGHKGNKRRANWQRHSHTSIGLTSSVNAHRASPRPFLTLLGPIPPDFENASRWQDWLGAIYHDPRTVLEYLSPLYTRHGTCTP